MRCGSTSSEGTQIRGAPSWRDSCFTRRCPQDGDDLEEARAIIGTFIFRYNTEWIVERLRYRTPAQARRDALREAA
jgi:hypothetical protein